MSNCASRQSVTHISPDINQMYLLDAMALHIHTGVWKCIHVGELIKSSNIFYLPRSFNETSQIFKNYVKLYCPLNKGKISLRRFLKHREPSVCRKLFVCLP